MSIYYVSGFMSIYYVHVLNEYVNAAHDGAHVLSYDSGGRNKKKRKGGAAHSPRMSAAFTLNPDLPLCSAPSPPPSFIFYMKTELRIFI